MKKFGMFISLFLLVFTGSLSAQWKYTEVKDPITDEPQKAVGVMNEQGHVLYFQKIRNGYAVVLTWNKFFGGDADRHVKVEYRFDDRPHVEQRWEMLAKRESAFIHTDNASNFIRAAMGSKKLIMRITDPLDGESLISEFTFEGLESAVAKMRQE